LATFVAAHNKVFLMTTGFTVRWNRVPMSTVVSHPTSTSMWQMRFVEGFASRPDYGFVMQYDGPTIDALPGNVHVSKWLPQQDVLGASASTYSTS